jgi:hypothetical protein
MAIHTDDSLVLRVVVQKSEDPEDPSLLGTVDLLGANLIAMHPNDNPLGIPMTTLQSDAARFTLAVSGSRPCAWRCGEITLRSDYTSQEGWLVASMFAGGGSSRTAGPDTYYRGMAFESAFTVTSAEGNEGDGGSIVLIVASELEAKTFLAKQLAGRELFRLSCQCAGADGLRREHAERGDVQLRVERRRQSARLPCDGACQAWLGDCGRVPLGGLLL